MTKTQGNFKLKVAEGEFTDSQIVVMLGENGTGKTTFIRMLVCLFHKYVMSEIAAVYSLLCYNDSSTCVSVYCRLVY